MRKITAGKLALPDAIKIIQEQQAMIAELQRLLAAAARARHTGGSRWSSFVEALPLSLAMWALIFLVLHVF